MAAVATSHQTDATPDEEFQQLFDDFNVDDGSPQGVRLSNGGSYSAANADDPALGGDDGGEYPELVAAVAGLADPYHDGEQAPDGDGDGYDDEGDPGGRDEEFMELFENFNSADAAFATTMAGNLRASIDSLSASAYDLDAATEALWDELCPMDIEIKSRAADIFEELSRFTHNEASTKLSVDEFKSLMIELTDMEGGDQLLELMVTRKRMRGTRSRRGSEVQMDPAGVNEWIAASM